MDAPTDLPAAGSQRIFTVELRVSYNDFLLRMRCKHQCIAFFILRTEPGLRCAPQSMGRVAPTYRISKRANRTITPFRIDFEHHLSYYIGVTHSEEFMKKVLHQTKDTPLHPLSSSRKQRTEGTCPAAPPVCEHVAKARGVGGVPKRIFA